MPDDEGVSEERWLNAPELTLSAGMTDEEIRATAVSAAATWWGPERGSSSRDVLKTAERFADYIREGRTDDH